LHIKRFTSFIIIPSALSVSGRASRGVVEPQIGTPTHFTTMLRLNHTYTHTKTKLLT